MDHHPLPPQEITSLQPPTPQNPPPEVSTAPPGDTPQKPVKKPQKGLILAILATLLVLSGVITAILSAQTDSLQNLISAQQLSQLLPFLPKPTPSATPEPNPTSIPTLPDHTILFQHENLPYSFEYPSSLDYLLAYPVDENIPVLLTIGPQEPIDLAKKESGGFGAGNPFTFNIYHYLTPPQPIETNDQIQVTSTNVELGGYPATKYHIIYQQNEPDFNKGDTQTAYDLEYQNQYIRISQSNTGSAELFSQILSTFKFTQDNRSNDQKTLIYSSQKYPYQFSYPSKFQKSHPESTYEKQELGLLTDPHSTTITKIEFKAVDGYLPKDSYENKWTSFKLDGNPAYYMSLPQTPDQSLLVATDKNNVIYDFTFTGTSDFNNPTVQQILSTFKFTN